jgi:hypothetical protein
MKTDLASFASIALIACLASTASADYVPAASATDLVDWRDMAGLPGGTDPSGNLYSAYGSLAGWHTSERIETFAGLSNPSNGTASNWWKWSASSPTGSVGFGTGIGPAPSSDDPDRAYIYAMPAGSSLLFTFDGATIPAPAGSDFVSGLRGIGGGFRFFDADGASVSGRITLTLSNGDSVVRNYSSDQAFAGFWLTDQHTVITSLKLDRFGSSGSGFFIGAHTMYLGYAGIPAPGAIALLGAAGFIASNRRRD